MPVRFAKYTWHKLGCGDYTLCPKRRPLSHKVLADLNNRPSLSLAKFSAHPATSLQLCEWPVISGTQCTIQVRKQHHIQFTIHDVYYMFWFTYRLVYYRSWTNTYYGVHGVQKRDFTTPYRRRTWQRNAPIGRVCRRNVLEHLSQRRILHS